MRAKFLNKSRALEWVIVTSTMAVICARGSWAQAQATENVINLCELRYETYRLGPDAASGSVAFESVDADPGEKISVRMTSSAGGIATRITAPAGEEINADNVTPTYGGTYVAFELTGCGNDSFIPLGIEPGFHQDYQLPSLGPGTYTVHFVADPVLATDVVLIAELRTESPVGGKRPPPPCRCAAGRGGLAVVAA